VGREFESPQAYHSFNNLADPFFPSLRDCGDFCGDPSCLLLSKYLLNVKPLQLHQAGWRRGTRTLRSSAVLVVAGRSRGIQCVCVDRHAAESCHPRARRSFAVILFRGRAAEEGQPRLPPRYPLLSPLHGPYALRLPRSLIARIALSHTLQSAQCMRHPPNARAAIKAPPFTAVAPSAELTDLLCRFEPGAGNLRILSIEPSPT